MKRLTLFSLLGLLTALLLSGCGGADTPAATDAPEDAAAASAAAERDFDGPYTPADSSLLAATGRPQLLNFYADW